MRKIAFSALAVFVFAVLTLNAFALPDETDMREFRGGVLVYVFSQFREEEWPKELKDELLACGECPGIDGYLPDYYTKNVELKLKDKVYRIPKTLTEDLYNPHVGKSFHRDSLRIVGDDKTIIINMRGGDGAGAYKVEFTINLTKMTVRRELFRVFNIEIPIIKEGKLEN